MIHVIPHLQNLVGFFGWTFQMDWTVSCTDRIISQERTEVRHQGLDEPTKLWLPIKSSTVVTYFMLQSSNFVVVTNLWMCARSLQRSCVHLHLLSTMYYKTLHSPRWLTSFPTPLWAGGLRHQKLIKSEPRPDPSSRVTGKAPNRSCFSAQAQHK